MAEKLRAHYHYVVIGGGVAGVSCVRQLAIELESQGISYLTRAHKMHNYMRETSQIPLTFLMRGHVAR